MKLLLVNTLQKISHLFFAILAPPLCAHCKIFIHIRTPFCTACTASVTPVVTVTVLITKQHSMKVYAISGYSDPIKGLILAKSSGAIVASSQLGQLMWDMTNIRYAEFDCIVPIPLHWTRYARRGYNQAEEIAHELSKRSGKPVINLLCRVRRTPFQSSLPVEQRAGNVKEVFEIVKKYKARCAGMNILLVDDVMTTGATLKVAGKELLSLKPKSVLAVVGARMT